MKKAMKIMAMVLFAIGMTALTSCSKDKDKLIVGKWELKSFSVHGGEYDMEMSIDEFMEMMGAEEDEMIDIVFEFKSDGRVYIDEQSASYSINGDQLIIEGIDNEDGEVMNETLTIKELTEKALTLERTEYDEEIGSDMTVGMHFKRVK